VKEKSGFSLSFEVPRLVGDNSPLALDASIGTYSALVPVLFESNWFRDEDESWLSGRNWLVFLDTARMLLGSFAAFALIF